MDWEKVLQQTDYVMLCLKGMDNSLAGEIAQFPPTAMARSKAFARYIRDKHADHTKVSLRWVLLKDKTDTMEELDRLVAFTEELRPVFTHVELIPFHDLGRQKYERLGETNAMADIPVYELNQARNVQKWLEDHGVRATLHTV